MSVTFKTTMTCEEHPKYTGKRANKRVDDWQCWGCIAVYEWQRDFSCEAKVEITEVQYNG